MAIRNELLSHRLIATEVSVRRLRDEINQAIGRNDSARDHRFVLDSMLKLSELVDELAQTTLEELSYQRELIGSVVDVLASRAQAECEEVPQIPSE